MNSTFSTDSSSDGLANPAPERPAHADEWTKIFDNLHQRYPGASQGVLFCIYKLQQDPDLKLRDFKHEAELHRVPLSGRSFHSARVLLGLERPAVARPKVGDDHGGEGDDGDPADGRRGGKGRARSGEAKARSAAPGDDSPAIAALRRFQADSAAENERMRASIRRALEIIDAALDD